MSRLPCLQPEMMEADALHIGSIDAKRMKIAFAILLPVDKFNAKFERRLGRAHECAFVNAEHGVEFQNFRNCCLANTYRSYFL